MSLKDIENSLFITIAVIVIKVLFYYTILTKLVLPVVSDVDFISTTVSNILYLVNDMSYYYKLGISVY